MSVNFFGQSDGSNFHNVFKYNRKFGFGVSGFDFSAYGHGNLDGNGDGFFNDGKRERYGDWINTPQKFDSIMSDLSPSYNKLMDNGNPR